MIRSLRHRHRSMIAVLAMGGVFVLAVGLSARRTPIDNADLTALETASPTESHVLYRRQDLFADSTLEIELRHSQVDAQSLRIGVRAIRPLRVAAGHFYWHPGPPADARLPVDAYSLGATPEGQWLRYILPPPAERQDGYLLLYSVAHDSVVAAAALPSASALRVEEQ